jgi:spermidine/putrescine transport system ATP-binding protein
MIELRGITKRFGAFTAVNDINLTVHTGEFLTLLGPSGCGKTTLLRLLAGFETPDEGVVLLDGEDVSHVPPYRRSVNQVFQSYALFPHMNVKDNVGFGLRMQNVPATEAEGRIREALATVSLAEQAHKFPHQMSGGQRQRVALARAIVCRPKVLLLDEPLSALDAKLRHGMQLELKHLQRKLGLTFVFVTHDQEEALTMSDRIAIINHGRIEQLGNATEIYHRPRTPFAADFIGQANLLSGSIILRNGTTATVRLETGLELVVACTDLPAGANKALVSIRPEKIHIGRSPAVAENVFEARIEEEIFQGATDQLRLVTDQGARFHALVANESATQEAFHAGDRVYCSLHLDDLVIVQTE